MTKIDKNNKFKMAAAAILNSVYRSKFSCCCTYSHEISYGS